MTGTDAVEVDRSPPRIAGAVAVGAAVVAVGVTLLSPLGLLTGALGLVCLLNGLLWPSRRALTAGACLLFAGVLLAGVDGAPAGPVLLGTVAAVVAWDVGHVAIGIGRQLGRRATTRRLEATRAAVGVGVGLTAAALGYVVFRLGAGGRPTTALVLLLFAGVVLVSALR